MGRNNASRHFLRPSNSESGVTLIEVLVAIVVTAIGVLGAAALQLNAVKFNQVANFRSTAVFLANDISDRMRANRDLALNGQYDIAFADEIPSGGEIYAVDLREWLTELGERLPDGDGAVVRNGSVFSIAVRWNEARLSETREAGAGDLQNFVFTTEL